VTSKRSTDIVERLLDDGELVPLIDKWLQTDSGVGWGFLAKRVTRYCDGRWRPSGATLEYAYRRMKAGQWVEGRRVIDGISDHGDEEVP
jgi:hypothetical protein